jgi:hypothetical protein
MAVERIDVPRIDLDEHIIIHESRISKMCRNDRGIIYFWILFMWLILAAVATKVSEIADDPIVKIIALVAGVLVGLLNTAALIAVSGHLKNKKNLLYSEDIFHLEKMQGGAGAKKWDFWKVFDVLFILILCYLCLLMPIVLRGKVLVGGGSGGGMLYTFTWSSLILVVGAAVVFGYFLVTHSEKELKALIDNVYGKKGEKK